MASLSSGGKQQGGAPGAGAGGVPAGGAAVLGPAASGIRRKLEEFLGVAFPGAEAPRARLAPRPGRRREAGGEGEGGEGGRDRWSCSALGLAPTWRSSATAPSISGRRLIAFSGYKPRKTRRARRGRRRQQAHRPPNWWSITPRQIWCAAIIGIARPGADRWCRAHRVDPLKIASRRAPVRSGRERLRARATTQVFISAAPRPTGAGRRRSGGR